MNKIIKFKVKCLKQNNYHVAKLLGHPVCYNRLGPQHSVDVMARWAARNRMSIAGSQTQLLFLSQWSQDAKNARIRVAGTEVPGTSHLKLLGVTFDRLLHFGQHCTELRRKVRPRIAQLRKLTGHFWGLREH